MCQESTRRRGRENGRKSAMSTSFATCHYCKKTNHIVRDCKRKLEREYEIEKSEKFNHKREKKWCSYHQTNGHSDNKQCYQQMRKSENFKNGRQKKRCSLHKSTSHPNHDCFQPKSGSKCKNSSTVYGRNSEGHETYVVDSTTVECKSCCCSNGKVAKKFNESEVEYSPPPYIGFSFACCHLSLSHQADGFQMSVDSRFSKHFVHPKLIRRVEKIILDYTEINPPMEIKAAGHNTLLGTAQGISLVVVRDTQDVCRNVKLSIVLVPGLERNLFSTALIAQKVSKPFSLRQGPLLTLGFF